ncbi:MAG: aldo/keto reductase [Sphingopyxis sp.]|nr:aldo/keto reductase [Sphingopyxis sp.]
MTHRPLGSSGLSIRPFVLGGNVFGMTAGRDASFAVLDRFVENGGGMIDTADVYSAWVPGHKGGESESMMGAWLKENGARGDVLIATKVGMMPGGLKPERIREAVQGSLERLGVETIDLYFAHKDDPDVPLDEVLGAFAELLNAGIVRAIGASNYSTDRLAEALRVADEKGLPRYSVVQPELNLLDRAQYQGALQNLCVAEGLGVVTYFSLASGYLSGKYRGADDLGKSPRGGRVKPYLEGKGPAMLEAMDAIAAETGASLSQIALAWVAAQPGVTAPIASATSVEQLDEIMGAEDLVPSDEQLAALTAAGA